MIVLPSVRLAAASDAAVIAGMSRDFIEHGLGWSWTPMRVLASLRDAETNVAVVREHQRLVAFGIMQYGERKAHLALLGVDHRQRRRGLASHVLRWLEAPAEAAGIERVQVEVRADNPVALAFYLARGFRARTRIPGYYRGRLDAVRLEKKLWPGPAP